MIERTNKFDFWVQRVLPQVYDESLSYYELLNKVVSFLNDVIEQTNGVTDFTEKELKEMRQDIAAFLSEYEGNLAAVVAQTIGEWQSSGKLEVIIADGLQWELDDYKATNEQDKLSINQQLTQISVNVQSFGAKGDGIADDRKAIQDAIDYVASQGGGKVIIPQGVYLLKTTHTEDIKSNLVIKHNDIQIITNGNWTILKNDVAGIDQVIKAKVEDTTLDRVTFDGLRIDANNKANYAFKADGWLVNWTYNKTRFEKALVNGYSAPIYLSEFNNCTFALNVESGCYIEQISGTYSTSLTFNSCYSIQNKIGFDGHYSYCTFNSCACDHISQIAYKGRHLGVSFNSCGAEGSKQLFKFESFQGVAINTFYGLGNGSENVETQPDYMIEFATGADATVQGVYNNQPKKFGKMLGVTGNSWGRENVTVLDDTITRNQIGFVSNFTFDRPIKLIRGDETQKNKTYDTSLENLQNVFDELSFSEVNHTITINITSGSDITTIKRMLRNITGCGKVIVSGTPGIKLLSGFSDLELINCRVPITIKNVTIENTRSSGNSILFSANNSIVKFDNVLFRNPLSAGGCIVLASEHSDVSILTTNTTDGVFESEGVYEKYQADLTSTLRT